MSDISDAELYSLITNVYKPPKNLHFPETEWSFRIARLEELPWLYYSWWEDGAYCLPGVLFGHKVVGSSSLENLYRKPYRTWPTAVKTFKKHQNTQTRSHKKSQIVLTRFLDEYTGKVVPTNKVFVYWDSLVPSNPSKSWGPVNSPLFENLVGGSTPPCLLLQKGGRKLWCCRDSTLSSLVSL